MSILILVGKKLVTSKLYCESFSIDHLFYFNLTEEKHLKNVNVQFRLTLERLIKITVSFA
jgi:hypothetical protein